MASAEGPGNVSFSIVRRAEALVRALAGVEDARVDTNGEGHLSSVHVVPSQGTGTKAVVRNVQTALRAALNIAIDTRSIFVADQLPQAALESVATAAPTSVPKEAVKAQPASVRRGAFEKAPQYGGAQRPARIELLELQRFGLDQLQCRVVIEANGRRRSGSADAGEEREGVVTLAARATLDALRHVEPGTWTFEGAADVIIGGQRHVVVSIRKDRTSDPLSGAAQVHESVEHAVALAVLNAAGLGGAAQLTDSERRAATH